MSKIIFVLVVIIELAISSLVICQPRNKLPQIFEKGIISTGDYDTHPAFSPTGDTLFFVKCSPDFRSWTIYVSYKTNGKWSEPVIPEFSGFMDADPFFSKDGKTLYFISSRPVNNETTKTDLDIWKVIKTERGWSKPIHLDPPINSDEDEYYPTLTNDGTMYFGSKRKDGKGACDIYKSKLVNGKYETAENLGDAINTIDNEYEPFISPDEKFMIFMAARPQALSNADLYISHNKNGSWTEAEKLPSPFNSSAIEFSPKITWDGKYFVFSSTRNTKSTVHQETTSEYTSRIRSAGNGLGDIYIIDLSEVNFLNKNQ